MPLMQKTFNWQYRDYVGWNEKLTDRATALLSSIRCPEFDQISACQDTRESHQYLFENLTPADHPYFAGHYRGEPFELLRNYHCAVSGKLACPPQTVAEEMSKFRTMVRARLRVVRENVADLSEADRFSTLATFVAETLHRFLGVHPFADGNGHIARLLVCYVMVPYEFLPVQWTVHPRPLADNEYIGALRAFDQGDKSLLVKLILNWFSPP